MKRLELQERQKEEKKAKEDEEKKTRRRMPKLQDRQPLQNRKEKAARRTKEEPKEKQITISMPTSWSTGSSMARCTQGGRMPGTSCTGKMRNTARSGQRPKESSSRAAKKHVDTNAVQIQQRSPTTTTTARAVCRRNAFVLQGTCSANFKQSRML